MKTFYIPVENWESALDDAIDRAQDGDTIVLRSAEQLVYVARAVRLTRPEKSLVIQAATKQEEHNGVNHENS